MPGAVDLFYVLLAVIVVTIVVFIVRAVRLTNAVLANASRDVNLMNPDVAASVATEIRGREMPCPRCGNETFALLGTQNRYKCDTCYLTCDGPAHIPG